MADLRRTVEIVFNGVNKVGPEVEKLDKQLRGLAAPASDITKSLIAMEAALVALTTAAGLYAYGAAVDFESVMLDLKKLLSPDETDLDGYARKVKDIGAAYGISANDAADSVIKFKQTGVDVASAFQLAETSIKTVKATGLDIGDVSERLSATLAGFGTNANDAARVTDIWNKGSDNFNTTVEELSIALNDFSPIAKQAGFSIEEAAGVMTPVLEVFKSGSETANSFKSGLLSLVNPAGQTKDAMAALGISTTDANGEFRSGKDIFFDVAKAMEKLDEEQRLVYAGQLFGKEQAGKMAVATRDLGATINATNIYMEAAGSITKELAVKMQGGQVAIDRMKVAFDNAAITVGTKYKDALTGVINGTTAIVSGFDKAVSDGAFNKLFDLVNPLLDEFAKELEAIGAALPEALSLVEFDSLVQAAKDLGQEMKIAFDLLFGPDLDLTKPEDLAKFLQRVVDLIASFTNVTTGILESFRPIFAAIGDLAGDSSKASTETEKALGSILGTLTALGEGGIALAGFIVYVKETGVEVKTIMDNIGNVASFIFNLLQATFDAFAGAIAEGISTVNSGLAMVTFGETSAEFQKNADDWRLTAEATKVNFEKNLGEAGKAFDALLKKSETSVTRSKESGTKFSDHITTLTTAIDDKLSKVPDSVADATKTAMQKIETDLDMAKVASDERVKTSEIEAKVTLERIKTNAETTKQAIETNAKIATKEIEAGVKRIEQLLGSVNTIIDSTGNTLSSLFGSLNASQDPFKSMDIRAAIDKEIRLRKQAADDAHEIAEIEIKLGEAKLKRLEQGGGLINIQADGLEPELEAFMWKIVEKLQVRVAEDRAEFLLGWGG